MMVDSYNVVLIYYGSLPHSLPAVRENGFYGISIMMNQWMKWGTLFSNWIFSEICQTHSKTKTKLFFISTDFLSDATEHT